VVNFCTKQALAIILPELVELYNLYLLLLSFNSACLHSAVC